MCKQDTCSYIFNLNFQVQFKCENSKLTKNRIGNFESNVKFNNHEDINHELENLADDKYELKFLPSKVGDYFVTFLKDGYQIQGLYKEELIQIQITYHT